MKAKIEMTLVLIALLGALMIGRGITGFVISESCCFSGDCSEEDRCESAAVEESPADVDEYEISAYIGWGMLVFSLAILAVLKLSKKKHGLLKDTEKMLENWIGKK